MKLPNHSNAFVSTRKISDYLLSEYHTVGKSKAKFLRSFGFDETNADQLEQALIQIAHNYPVIETMESPYGTKYIVDGNLEAPNGVMIRLRTVWIVEVGNEVPRFVTAYPPD